MQGIHAITGFSRRRLLIGGLVLAAGGRAAAAQPLPPAPIQTAVPGSGPTIKPASAWLAYEAALQSRLTNSNRFYDVDFGRDLLVQANAFRDDMRLAPYVWDEDLAACARAHAADMASRNYFGHSTPEGFTHLERVALLCRDSCGKTAENLAWRSSSASIKPADVEGLWETSPGHRRNLLRENFKSAGYGVVRANGAYYAAGVYADASVRLARALPLWIRDEPQLKGALADSSPAIEHVSVTSPFEQPTWMAATAQRLPSLREGAWQLRPLAPVGDGRFSALSGPTFFVS